MLYMPGSNPRALDKARSLPADSLILDLEDSVSPDAKQQAREQVVAALEEGGYGHREIIVRINVMDGEWVADDLAAIANSKARPDGILVPKVSTALEVEQAVATADMAGCDTGIDIWIMAETPQCILNIGELASAHPRLKGIVLGTSDLAKDTRVRHTPDRMGFIAALNLCVYAARANGLDVIDGVQLDLDDEAALEASCIQGRDLGFDGKSLIHPKQLAAANKAFAPSDAEIATARELIAGFEQAEAQGKGVVVVNGRLVEALHVEEAQRCLALADAIASLEA
ncbi:CoA ester lyase [Halioglobus maricola]|uniref:CoA ester lyase n=2 Tax=Halioglobus maricola TaxID=2601894 RepID=A0A5P9NPU4_9GAMM|nr:CoA ester lyase [Halioglobus maricola]